MFKAVNNLREEKGFTLIELLIVVAIIGILAAIAIPGYIGMQERSRKGAVTRAASAAEPELQAWLNSSLKVGQGAKLREVDTSGDGQVTDADDINKLLSAAVCIKYVAVQKTDSPWGTGLGLWLVDTGTQTNGSIMCSQPVTNARMVVISALDLQGNTIHTKTLFSD